MADLTSQLASLNPFSRKKKKIVDDEDQGETLTYEFFAQQSQAVAADSAVPRARVSDAIQSFLVRHGAISYEPAGDGSGSEALRTLLGRPIVNVPPDILARDHPLTEYFVSSSHNTYLLAHQLYGTSCASGYETALRTGSRCVEIDAWDNEDDIEEPKVTHGFTLVSKISFRSVCETIRDFWDEEAARTQGIGAAASPILLSLENHCKEHGQRRLVHIMKEVFGPRLLSEAVIREEHGLGPDEKVTLEELGGKIAVIVEYHIPGEAESSDYSSDDSSDEEEEREARKAYRGKKKDAVSTIIVPELAELGVYAQSVKPGDTSWFASPTGLINGPHHHLINLSESGLNGHLKEHAVAVAKHNAKYLMRVYPKGIRIASSNLQPVPYWGVGAQICALNWQTFGGSNQLNEAMFAGSDGYVLKPGALRAGGNGSVSTDRRKRLRVHVCGATDVPMPHGDGDDSDKAGDFRPYLTCTLHHPSDLSGKPVKRKTSAYKTHKLSFLHSNDGSTPTDPIWDEVLEWEYDDSELVFLRMLIKNDESWSRNRVHAVAALRLLYVETGTWRFVRMRDLHGVKTGCTLLLKFDIEDI